MQLCAPANPITLTAHGSRVSTCHSWTRLSSSPKQTLSWETKPIQTALKPEELHLEILSQTLLPTPPIPNRRHIPCVHLSHAKLSHHPPVGIFSTNPQVCSNRRHLAFERYCSHTSTCPTATGNYSQVCVTPGQGCTPHLQFTFHSSASLPKNLSFTLWITPYTLSTCDTHTTICQSLRRILLHPHCTSLFLRLQTLLKDKAFKLIKVITATRSSFSCHLHSIQKLHTGTIPPWGCYTLPSSVF